jgi:hypothetical protein
MSIRNSENRLSVVLCITIMTAFATLGALLETMIIYAQGESFFETSIREANETNSAISSRLNSGSSVLEDQTGLSESSRLPASENFSSGSKIVYLNESLTDNATGSLEQQGQQIQTGLLPTFENSSFGFRIEHPSDWQIVNEYKRVPTFENLQLGMLLFFLPQGILSSDHNSTFWVEVEYLPNRFMPLDKFVESEIEGLYGGQAKILSRSPININGHTAEKVELVCCGSEEILHEVRIYLTNGELGYTMVYSASPPSLYLLFLKDADNVVKSFRFLNSSE